MIRDMAKYYRLDTAQRAARQAQWNHPTWWPPVLLTGARAARVFLAWRAFRPPRTAQRARRSAGLTLTAPAMLNYIIRRIGYGVLILLGVNLATFFLFFTVNTPDDMARLNIGGKRITEEQIANGRPSAATTSRCTGTTPSQGSENFTETIFWERSVSLFTLDFGRADARAPATSATRSTPACGRACNSRCRCSCLQVIASTVFALLLVFFRSSRSISGASCCAC